VWVLQDELQLPVGNKPPDEEDMSQVASQRALLVLHDKELVGHRDCSGVGQDCDDMLGHRGQEVLHEEVVLPGGVHADDAADGAAECDGVEYGGAVDDTQLVEAVCHRLLAAMRKKWGRWVAMLIPWHLFVAEDPRDLGILAHRHLALLLVGLVDCIVPLLDN